MWNTSIKAVLLLEDNPGDARLLREMLNEQESLNTQLTHLECMSDAEKYLAEHAVDIILLDLGLPDAQGLAAVRRAHAAAPHVPLVVLTGLDDELVAAQALQEGAQDYLIKGQIETSRADAGAALCHRAQDHGRGVVRGKGARPGHASTAWQMPSFARTFPEISPSSTSSRKNLTGWPWQEAAGRPMLEVFRVLRRRKR